MPEVGHGELRRLAIEAIAWEGDIDDGESGHWRVTKPFAFVYEARDASGQRHHVTLTGTVVEPRWSDGDSTILCESEQQAAYIAAADPQTVLGLLGYIERLTDDIEAGDTVAIRAWWQKVCDLAESKMLASGRLEGMHYAAAQELLP